MNLGENATNRSNSLHHFQEPEQPSSRFIDRFIRLKTTYWNREYAIVMLALIGLAISTNQDILYDKFVLSVLLQTDNYHFHYDYSTYYQYGFYTGLIPGGILATVYPAHNILGIFVTISSISHLVAAMGIHFLDVHMHCFIQFFMGITMATLSAAIDSIWTYWVPLNKQPIRHVPIILYSLIFDDGYFHKSITNLFDTHSSYTLALSSGIGLAWYVLWLYAINGNQFWRPNSDLILYGGSKNPRYSFGTSGVSLTQSIVTDIPWKSFCTSKPVFAIALLYACDVRLNESNGGDFMIDSFLTSEEVVECTLITYIIIALLLFVILVELVPEITLSISTTSVRKFWSCSYFSLMGVFFFIEAISGNILRTNKICNYILKGMGYLFSFGFVNYLDIAPKYGSLLYSFLMTIHFISQFLCDTVSELSPVIFNEVETGILIAIICFAVAVLYAIFGSAEQQPWAADEPVEEYQQNMI